MKINLIQHSKKEDISEFKEIKVKTFKGVDNQNSLSLQFEDNNNNFEIILNQYQINLLQKEINKLNRWE